MGIQRAFLQDNSLSEAVSRVHSVITDRDRRQEMFPAYLFADPAWDILLELYRAELRQFRTSVTELCLASRVPYTTALRWMTSLETAGLLSRDGDVFDGRRIYVSLSTAGSDAMADYFGIGPTSSGRANDCVSRQGERS